MDRFFAPYVAVGFVLGSAVGLLALAAGASGLLAFAAAVLIGLTAGAEIDVIAFLCSRYFGLRCFGEIYGWQYAAYSAAAGIGADRYRDRLRCDRLLSGRAVCTRGAAAARPLCCSPGCRAMSGRTRRAPNAR